MPLLEIMQTTQEEIKHLNDTFQIDSLNTQKKQLELELISEQTLEKTEPLKGKNTEKNQKKKKKLKLKKEKELKESCSSAASSNSCEKTSLDLNNTSGLSNDLTLHSPEEEASDSTWTTVNYSKNKSIAPAHKSKVVMPAPMKVVEKIVSGALTPPESMFKTLSLLPPKALTETNPLDYSGIGKTSFTDNSHTMMAFPLLSKKQPSSFFPASTPSASAAEEEGALVPSQHYKHAPFFFKKPSPPSINKKELPNSLLLFSEKLKSLVNYPLILTGSAVKTLYKNVGQINDYDCLACNIPFPKLKSHIETWAKENNWQLTECKVVGTEFVNIVGT